MDITNPDFEKSMLAKRIIFFQEETTDKACDRIIASLEYLNAIDTVAPILLKINSPGGSTNMGGIIKDNIINSAAPVHGLVLGYNCSMSFIILQYCRRRLTYPNARHMMHAPSLTSTSKSVWADDFDETVRKTKEFFHYFLEDLAKRSGQSFEQLCKWAKEERFFSGYEAKDLGFVDEIINQDSY